TRTTKFLGNLDAHKSILKKPLHDRWIHHLSLVHVPNFRKDRLFAEPIDSVLKEVFRFCEVKDGRWVDFREGTGLAVKLSVIAEEEWRSGRQHWLRKTARPEHCAGHPSRTGGCPESGHGDTPASRHGGGED